jgi:hypothetical protein
MREARCHCGDLRLVCEGEPHKVSMCHCEDCQRRTGSAFSVAVFYAKEAVRLEGPAPERYERGSASGHQVSFFFCRRCGSNVFWRAERMPELIGVALGAFFDPSLPAATQSVWTREKHEWLVLPEGVVCFEAAPAATARRQHGRQDRNGPD